MITRLRYWTRYRTPNVDSGSHAKLNTKTLTYGRCYHATKGRKTVQALLPGEEFYDTASYARVYQHDVRAKQTKVCDAERTEFHNPAHASNYISTDGQLKLVAVFPPVDNGLIG